MNGKVVRKGVAFLFVTATILASIACSSSFAQGAQRQVNVDDIKRLGMLVTATQEGLHNLEQNYQDLRLRLAGNVPQEFLENLDALMHETARQVALKMQPAQELSHTKKHVTALQLEDALQELAIANMIMLQHSMLLGMTIDQLTEQGDTQEHGE